MENPQIDSSGTKTVSLGGLTTSGHATRIRDAQKSPAKLLVFGHTETMNP